MNHRNLKILILICWAVAFSIGLFAFVYYSIPGGVERIERHDLSKAYELDQNFKQQLENSDDLKIGQKAAELPISQADTMSHDEWSKLMEKADIYIAFNKNVSSNEVNIEIAQDVIRDCQNERVSKERKFYLVSSLFVVASLVFGLLLFITRDPTKTK